MLRAALTDSVTWHHWMNLGGAGVVGLRVGDRGDVAVPTTRVAMTVEVPAFGRDMLADVVPAKGRGYNGIGCLIGHNSNVLPNMQSHSETIFTKYLELN